jgi:uncharacterized protein (DUF362 family)
MTVLLSDGQKTLTEILNSILDAFLTEADYGRGIFIKPNIVFPVRPQSGEITSPLLVRTLIATLRERRANIDIVLGEGVAAGCDPQENFQVSGYTELAAELNVPLLDLHNVERQKVTWKFGTLDLPKVAFDRTYINLPILKPSSACVISGALKNQKGLVLPNVKKKFHCLGLHQQITELNAVVKPALTIMDASRFFGRRTFISGDNCGEIDATACELLGIEEPEHIQLSRTAQIFAPGYRVDGPKIRTKRASSNLKVKEAKRLGRLRLWANPRACTMCRYLFHEIKQDALNLQHLSAKTKLLAYSIQGAEIVMGSHADWRKEYGTVLCVGNCTRRVAKEGGYTFVPGCPPTLEDLYNSLANATQPKKATE